MFMKTKRILLTWLVMGMAMMGWAAPNSLYFMDLLPYQNYMNPALQPLCDSYVELPGISSVSASASMGGLSLNDFLYVKDGKLVTFLHPEYGSKDALYKKLRDVQRISADADVSLLGFGMRVKENGFFTFNLSTRMDAALGVPKDLMKFLLYGTPDEDGVNTYDLSSLSMSANLYNDISFGYSHKINDQWSVGARLHLLVGAAGADARFSSLSLEASKEQWRINSAGSARLSVPGLKVLVDDQGNVSGFSAFDITSAWQSYQLSMGAAVDLGVTYKPLPELTLSASIKDLGFMYWANLNQLDMQATGEFNGVYYDPENPANIIDSLLADVVATARLNPNAIGYCREMRGKLYIGAEYSFLRNMMSVGVLSKTEFMAKYVSEEISLNYKVRPCHWFGISAGYSIVSGGWSTIGFGMDIKLPPFNFYVATDYVPLYYSAEGVPYKSQAINVQAGIVLTFDTKDNFKRLTEQ